MPQGEWPDKLANLKAKTSKNNYTTKKQYKYGEIYKIRSSYGNERNGHGAIVFSF